jgi:stage V sporulation protein T
MEVTMLLNFPNIAAYCRISVDDEIDRDNTSIENQRAIIDDFIAKRFPGSPISYYEDRDRSGYTFEQREGYQQMRPMLLSRQHDILIIKDFSRFSRRNSRGLVELEDLRDAGVRIISVGDNVDFPTYDEWLNIQFRFLVNELPVTDASKKVKGVIKRRQQDGKWICAVPYGYVITNSKTMTFETEPAEAEIVRKVFELYNEGWGYKKIANHLTSLAIPTPRMSEKARKEARGEEYKRTARPEWSIITIEGMLKNDFYIGRLRQGKYARKKINGVDVKRDETDHIVFENHHEAIIDHRLFAATQEQLKRRSTSHYRGIRKYDNVYSGFLFCGDCGSPMFSMSRGDLRPAYVCGAYHRRGRAGCTSHHTRVDVLDDLLKSFIKRVRDNASEMLAELELIIKNESEEVEVSDHTLELLNHQLEDAKEELKTTKRMKIREIMKRPDAEESIEATYAELESDIERRIEGLENQIDLAHNRRSNVIKVSRIAKTAIDLFNDILEKEKLDKRDLNLMIERITIYEDNLDIQLKSDIDDLLTHGTSQIVQSAKNQRDKVFDVNIISNGDPLEIFTDREGEIILKKYSPIGELGSFAKEYTESLAQSSGHITCIVDKDQIIAVSGGAKKELMEKHISAELEKMINTRNHHLASRSDANYVPILEDEPEGIYNNQMITPIMAEGDVLGAIIFLSPDKKMGELETKLAQTAAGFIGKQMEQ